MGDSVDPAGETPVDIHGEAVVGPRRTGLAYLAYNFEEVVTALLVGVMIVSVCVSVFFRYALGQPIAWTEEIVLLCMVWVCFLGASVATKSREHIVIDILLVIVPKPVARVMEIFSLCVVLVILYVLVWQGIILVDKTQFMRTTALGIPEGFMYAAVPFSAALMFFHNARHLYGDLRGTQGR
ncbi:MAG: TRAP transporter small permease [Chloroflexota bacterium]